MTNVTKDLVVLVNEADVEIGTMDKFQAHRHPAQLHRAPSVWLINSNGEVLLQQRSQFKITAAGWWGNTVCGNVRPGEDYEGCALRRLKEELGIVYKNKLKPAFRFRYRAYANQEYGENEIDQVFVGKYDGPVNPQEKEVSDYVWMPVSELLDGLKKREYILPEDTINLTLAELEEETAPVLVKYQDRELELVPWSVMMGRDERLQQALKQL